MANLVFLIEVEAAVLEKALMAAADRWAALWRRVTALLNNVVAAALHPPGPYFAALIRPAVACTLPHTHVTLVNLCHPPLAGADSVADHIAVVRGHSVC
jgi:hypothetical protein